MEKERHGVKCVCMYVRENEGLQTDRQTEKQRENNTEKERLGETISY